MVDFCFEREPLDQPNLEIKAFKSAKRFRDNSSHVSRNFGGLKWPLSTARGQSPYGR